MSTRRIDSKAGVSIRCTLSAGEWRIFYGSKLGTVMSDLGKQHTISHTPSNENARIVVRWVVEGLLRTFLEALGTGSALAREGCMCIAGHSELCLRHRLVRNGLNERPPKQRGSRG